MGCVWRMGVGVRVGVDWAAIGFGVLCRFGGRCFGMCCIGLCGVVEGWSCSVGCSGPYCVAVVFVGVGVCSSCFLCFWSGCLVWCFVEAGWVGLSGIVGCYALLGWVELYWGVLCGDFVLCVVGCWDEWGCRALVRAAWGCGFVLVGSCVVGYCGGDLCWVAAGCLVLG